MELYYLAAFFFIYGILGWCVEVAYAAVKQGIFVNRGFLNGPICPIYGVGVVSVICCLSEVKGNIVALYVTSVILVTVIEGLTGLVMDRLFHHKWWDYSDQPLNIGGYVCLLFSLIWGVFCVFIMKVFQPAVRGVVIHIPFIFGLIILIVCLIGMTADVFVTSAEVLKLNKKLEAMNKIAAELRELSDRMGENIYENVKEGMEKEEKFRRQAESVKEAGRELKAEYDAQAHAHYEEILTKKEEVRLRYKEMRAKREELWERYEKMLRERGTVGERLMQAFPGMESRKYKDILRELKESIQTQIK